MKTREIEDRVLAWEKRLSELTNSLPPLDEEVAHDRECAIFFARLNLGYWKKRARGGIDE